MFKAVFKAVKASMAFNEHFMIHVPAAGFTVVGAITSALATQT